MVTRRWARFKQSRDTSRSAACANNSGTDSTRRSGSTCGAGDIIISRHDDATLIVEPGAPHRRGDRID
jgi:hypothetical protein